MEPSCTFPTVKRFAFNAPPPPDFFSYSSSTPIEKKSAFIGSRLPQMFISFMLSMNKSAAHDVHHR